MIFTKQQIIESSKAIAPLSKFEPSLICAIATQECQKTKEGNYDASYARLEQGFYQRYVVENLKFPSTVEAQFATSWGVWQLMGYELYRLKFFEWYFENIPTPVWREKVLQNPLSEICVTQALNFFATDLNIQCEYACKHLSNKRDVAGKKEEFKGETDKLRMTLLLWNGGSNPNYDDEVLEKQKAFL